MAARSTAKSSEDLTIQDDVLIADDGWLFLYRGSQEQMAFLTGTRQAENLSISNFWSNLESRAQFCAERSLPYVHIVFPSKPVVMTRFLPNGLRSQIESLYLRSYRPAAPATLAEHCLYPIDQLRALDATDLPFLPADTHMSPLGCATVAQAALARWGLGYDLDRFFQREPGTYQGDLSLMLGRREWSSQTSLRGMNLALVEFDNLCFLGSNQFNVTLIHSPHSITTKRLLVIGDSFFRMGLHFCSPVFREILYLRGPGFHVDTLTRFAPDAVMTGNAERYLASVPPDWAVTDILTNLVRKPNYLPDRPFRAALASQLIRPTAQALSVSEDAIAQLKQNLSELTAELAATKERAQQSRDAMLALREQKDARIKHLKRQARQQKKRLARAEQVLKKLQSSTSWRITRPLRRVLEGLRRLR